MISHGSGKTDFYQSVWCVIHAVNTCPQLQQMFPKSQQDCKDLATVFTGQSQAGFTNCVVCIDGMLLWMEKPSKQQCVEAGVDSGKFYCGREGKYGLNLQAVCDAHHHLLMCLCSTQHLHQTFCHLSHLLYVNNYLNILSQQDIVCMVIMPMSMTPTWQYLIRTKAMAQRMTSTSSTCRSGSILSVHLGY